MSKSSVDLIADWLLTDTSASDTPAQAAYKESFWDAHYRWMTGGRIGIKTATTSRGKSVPWNERKTRLLIAIQSSRQARPQP